MTLYKYISAEFGTKALDTERIRFTQPAALNDPFEGHPLFGEIFSLEQLNVLFDQLVSNQEFMQSMVDETVNKIYENADPIAKQMFPRDIAVPHLKRTLVQQLESLKSELPLTLKNNMRARLPEIQANAVLQVIQVLQQELVVFSLSASSTDPRLWALYADSQSGIGIGFNSEDPFLEGTMHVDYVIERPAISVPSELHSENQKLSIAAKLICTKGVEWEYEQEYRAVRAAIAAEEIRGIDRFGFQVYLFRFPTAAVRDVIFGSRIGKDQERVISAILTQPRYEHVRIGKVALNSSQFQLEISWLREAA